MDVGKRIKQRRKELHMSVDELAKQIGKNRATIYRYEKGDIENLPIDVLEPLAVALETSPQYLMGWDNNQQRYDKKKIELLVKDEDLTIGEMIQVIRTSRNLTIKDVSTRTGISIEDLQNYENGSKPLSSRALRYIGYIFGAELLDIADQLFRGNGLDMSKIEDENEYAKQMRLWHEEFGLTLFTDRELNSLFDYAKFLISQREK